MNGLFSVLTEDDLKRIAFVLLVILANFVFAVLGAIVRGGFDAKAGGLDYKKLPVFFTTQVLPFVVGLAFFEAFLHVLPPSELTQTLLSPANLRRAIIYAGHSATKMAEGAELSEDDRLTLKDLGEEEPDQGMEYKCARCETPVTAAKADDNGGLCDPCAAFEGGPHAAT